jgi:F plasmid transfer operon, TraF, protein
MKLVRPLLGLILLLTLAPSAASAQPFETVGVRALGMGGAFVAVADDATAVWWNPAGLATGGVFSMAIEHNTLDQDLSGEDSTGQRTGTAIIAATPALGLGYIRARVDEGRASLVTHQAGVTLLQTLVEGLVVGTSLKYVRGHASVEPDPGSDRTSNAFDLDAGVLYVQHAWRLGLTVKNIVAPDFETNTGGPLELQRLVRAGVAWLQGDWTASVDVDLNKSALSPEPSAPEERRILAGGTEWRWGRRLAARGGFRFNTAGDVQAPVATAGFGIAVWGSVWVDAHVAAGGDAADRGWGVAGRVHF